MAINTETTRDKGAEGKFFTLFVDDVEYRVQQDSLTGAQIMALASIPLEVGLILTEEDGTQRAFGADEVFTFEGPGRRFKRAPRFKRG